MKALLISLGLLLSGLAFSTTEFDVSADMDPVDAEFVAEALGQDTFDRLLQLSEGHAVSVKIFSDDPTESEDKDKGKIKGECEIVIDKKTGGSGGVSVSGPAVSASGQGAGSGSIHIRIKGPCKSVGKLLMAVMPID